MATFYNSASLSFGGNVINSNTTEAELLTGLSITKSAISGEYTAGGNVVYAITLGNMSATAYNDLTVTDNLGAYALPDTTVVVPLNYAPGSIRYYLDGVLQTAPTVSAVGELEISGIDLAPGSTATLIYETTVNEFAPVEAGSAITNTASTNGGTGIGVITASDTVVVREAANLTIAKAVCPTVVTDNGTVTYTIIVQNLGNAPVLATDGVVVSDLFNPPLSGIAVALDGVPLAEGTGYTYNEATGEFQTADGVITVPAATYTRDAATGAVTTVPGVTVLTVTGTA